MQYVPHWQSFFSNDEWIMNNPSNNEDPACAVSLCCWEAGGVKSWACLVCHWSSMADIYRKTWIELLTSWGEEDNCAVFNGSGMPSSGTLMYYKDNTKVPLQHTAISCHLCFRTSAEWFSHQVIMIITIIRMVIVKWAESINKLNPMQHLFYI